MARLLSILLTSLALLATSACSSEDDPAPPDDPISCEEGQRCGDACVDLDSDASHCGDCDRACPEAHACIEGQCIAPPSDDECEAEQERCGDSCVDTDTDATHCGACDSACGDGEGCEAGSCVAQCTGDQVRCDGVCTDLDSDPWHCGECGVRCDSDQICAEGACGCPEELSACGDECVDTRSDDAHCGNCDNACGDNAHCDAGDCACDEGFQLCGDTCVDTSSDLFHCGGCDQSCADLEGVAGAVCLESACAITACEAGVEDCNKDPGDGCERAIWDDPTNCGDCDIVCHDLNASATTCIHDACTPICEDGFGTCSANPALGCAIDHENDKDFCGDCFTACNWFCGDSSCYEAVEIASGEFHSCMLLNSGEVLCWGKNDKKQLGREVITESLLPLPIEIELEEDEEAPHFVQLSIGSLGHHACARTDKGAVWCWGGNQHGPVGNGSTDSSGVLPVEVIQEGASWVAAGKEHSCAVVEGALECWGRNVNKQAGPGTGPRITSPSRITVSGKVFTQVSAGGTHSCGLTTEGEIFCWGSNGNGQLGRGEKSSNSDTPEAVSILTEAAAGVAAGDNYTCAWTVDGAPYCWGNNTDGRLGDGKDLQGGGGLGGSPPMELGPVAVVGLSGVQRLATADKYACAVTSAATHCWGTNGSDGLLGDGTTLSTSTPVQIAGWGSSRSLGLGGKHNCLLDTKGVPSCWGRSDEGQYGNGTKGEPSSNPVPVERPAP